MTPLLQHPENYLFNLIAMTSPEAKRLWRRAIKEYFDNTCIYCGKSSESIDHILPRSRGGLSITENCVPACLSCNGSKTDNNAFEWYRKQRFYDPRRSMAIRAWTEGDIRLALRLLKWAQPKPIESFKNSKSKLNVDYSWQAA